jgi:hypothetical protein
MSEQHSFEVLYTDAPCHPILDGIPAYINYAGQHCLSYNDGPSAQLLLDTARGMIATCTKILPTLFNEDQREFVEYTETLSGFTEWCASIQNEIDLM